MHFAIPAQTGKIRLHSSGKNLHTADALSRVPVAGNEEDSQLEKEVEAFVVNAVEALPASEQRLNKYRQAQKKYPICQKIMEYCQHGRPGKAPVRQDVASFWKWKDSITQCNQLLMYGHRIVVPNSLQKEALEKIHAGHQGIE